MSKNGNGHNGHGEPKARGKKIRVAIVGVGNCASSLVQGRYYYENAKAGDFVPGLMHVQLGDYHISDVEFVAVLPHVPAAPSTDRASSAVNAAIAGFASDTSAWSAG